MDNRSLVIGILIGAAAMFLLIHLLWHMGFYFLYGIFGALRHTERSSSPGSKSLHKIEQMVLPMAKKDHRDLNPEALKSQIEQCLKAQYGTYQDFRILDLGLTDYRKKSPGSVLIFEGLISWQEKKQRQQSVRISMERKSMEGFWEIVAIKEI